MRAWIAAALFLAAACSGGGSSAMTPEQLGSELRELRSLSAETELFRTMLIDGRVTKRFAQGHAQYLRETAAEHGKKLARARAAPGLEGELAHARDIATTLGHVLDILSAQVQ